MLSNGQLLQESSLLGGVFDQRHRLLGLIAKRIEVGPQSVQQGLGKHGFALRVRLDLQGPAEKTDRLGVLPVAEHGLTQREHQIRIVRTPIKSIGQLLHVGRNEIETPQSVNTLRQHMAATTDQIAGHDAVGRSATGD